MTLSKRQRNRRFVRRNVLDVRMRTREANSARNRLIAAASLLAAGAAAVLYGLWLGGQWVVEEMVFRNPAFAVSQIKIDTGQRLPAEMVLSWSGIRDGDNLIELNLDRVKQRLELLSVVRSVSLERLPPDTLRIRVTARIPVAEIRSVRKSRSGGLELTRFYVDGDGVVLQFPSTSEAALRQRLVREPLPQLLGVHGPVAGQALAEPTSGPALQLIRAFDSSPMFGVTELESLDLGRKGALKVRTSHGSVITFGLRDFERQLGWWRQVHDYGIGRGQTIETMDLSVTNNVPVVFKDAHASRATPGSGMDNQTP